MAISFRSQSSSSDFHPRSAGVVSTTPGPGACWWRSDPGPGEDRIRARTRNRWNEPRFRSKVAEGGPVQQVVMERIVAPDAVELGFPHHGVGWPPREYVAPVREGPAADPIAVGTRRMVGAVAPASTAAQGVSNASETSPRCAGPCGCLARVPSTWVDRQGAMTWFPTPTGLILRCSVGFRILAVAGVRAGERPWVGLQSCSWRCRVDR
jgi:hypothetical protein